MPPPAGHRRKGPQCRLVETEGSPSLLQHTTGGAVWGLLSKGGRSYWLGASRPAGLGIPGKNQRDELDTKTTPYVVSPPILTDGRGRAFPGLLDDLNGDGVCTGRPREALAVHFRDHGDGRLVCGS